MDLMISFREVGVRIRVIPVQRHEYPVTSRTLKYRLVEMQNPCLE